MPDLLPPNATPLERGLSLSTARDIDVPLKQLWSPYTCPPEVLSYLAWALSVDEWNPTADEATKRQIIAASVEDHRRKGTVGALKKALQRLGLECEIDENTGTAYTFRLKRRIFAGQSAGGAVMEAEQNAAIAIALRQKNARSELIGTSLFADTAPAPAYIGAVAIGGVDCSIKQPPTPLPLDGYRDGLAASFWTVRMQTDYAGPIGIVKRASDNAELTYYSLAELKAFVEGETLWRFVALFCQSRYFLRARPLIENPVGEFDANGIPYITNTYGLVASIPRTRLGTYSIASAFKNDSGDGYFLTALNDAGEQIFWGAAAVRSGGTLSYSLFSATDGGGLTRTLGAAPETNRVFVGSSNIESRLFTVTDGYETETYEGTTSPSEADYIRLNKIKLSGLGRLRFYGLGLWDIDLGEEGIQALAETLNDKFQE